MDYKEKFEDFLDKMQGLLDNAKKQGHIIVRVEDLENTLTEIKEDNEDERIRQKFIKLVKMSNEVGGFALHKWEADEMLAWLEKQGELVNSLSKGLDNAHEQIDSLIQEHNELCIKLEKQGEPFDDNIITREDEILQAISIGLTDIEEDFGWPDFGGLPIKEIQDWLKKQSEQEPSNKVEPKFKVGDLIRLKDGDGLEWTIEEMHNDGYYTIVCEDRDDFIYLDDRWELVEKLADKNGSKFHEGDWVVCEAGECTSTLQITDIKSGYYWFHDDSYLPVVDEDCLRLWTIDDARDGDVLAVEPIKDCPNSFIAIYKERGLNFFNSYCFVSLDGEFNKGTTGHDIYLIHPATKEQRDTLFAKMKKAGYEWDAEKKELKKIEDEEYNGEDYGIDSIYHAQRILEKTLGSVDGYQTDDGILSHRCAITAIKKLYKQQPAWSEEDEKRIANILSVLSVQVCWDGATGEKMNPYQKEIDWLKSLKERYTWRPSNEQIEALEHFVRSIGEGGYASPYDNNTKLLYSLLEQLKKLKA